MLVVKATLIQDILDYLTFLDPYVDTLMKEHCLPWPLRKEAVFRWIIEKELATLYHLFAVDHERHHSQCIQIYQDLNQRLPHPLHAYTKASIMAPVLYHDHNEIKVSLRSRDLYIEYFRDKNRIPVITTPNFLIK